MHIKMFADKDFLRFIILLLNIGRLKSNIIFKDDSLGVRLYWGADVIRKN